ncbi:MAG: tetratricopeptide repeat protein [Planctomycetota bacterium]
MARLLDAFSEAEQVYKKSPSSSPPAVYFIKGNVQLQRKEYLNAISSLKEVTKRLPKLPQPHYLLALALTESGQIEKAKREFRTAFDYTPGFVPAKLGLASLLVKDGKHKETIELCKNILEIDPENVNAMQILGTAYMGARDFKNAEEFFGKVLEAKPKVGDINMAHLSLASGQLSKCIRQCEQIVKISPEEPEAYDILGLAHVRRGDFDKGIEQFQKAIAIAPSSIMTHLNLAKAYVLTGENEEAIKTLEDLISLDPNNLHANIIQANLYIKEGNINEATKTLEKVLEINPDYLPGYALASLYLLQDRADETIDLCNRALKLDPEDAMLHINLAVAYQQKKNYTASILSCQKAFKLRPEMPFLNILVTNIYTVNGELVKAKEQVESIIEKKEDVSTASREDEHSSTEMIEVPGLRQTMKEALDNYYAVAAKLSNDSVENIGKNLDLIVRHSRNVRDMEFNIPEDSFKRLSEITKKIEDDAIEMKGAELEGARKRFKNLSRSMLSYLKEFHGKIKDSGKACVYYCPMAEALWLQDEEGANNPYFGAKMLRCGSMTNIFTANVELVKAKEQEQEQLESISTLTDVQKKEYLELIDLCENNREKGSQVTLALNKAIVARQKGIFNLAISECEKAAKITPENLIPKMLLASTYLFANQKEEAGKTYNEIINSNPEFASHDLGMAYLMVDKQDEAISIYRNMVDMESEPVPARLTLARLLLKKGSIDEAVKMVGEATELDPENLIAHNLLGELSLLNAKYEDAEVEFSKMMQLNNDTFEGHFNMARVKFVQGNYDECIRHCKRGLQIKPADIRLHNILGMAYMKKGMLNDAVAEFNKIIDINSDFIPAYLNLAGINLNINRPDVAAILFNAALKINPDTVNARLGLGNSYALMGNLSGAVDEFKNVVKSYPGNVNAYISLARSYMALNKNNKARETITNALSLEPENPIARSLLAGIYVRNEDIPQAIDQLKAVLSDNPKFIDAYELGILYMDNGEYDNAISTYKQGVENFPDNASLWCNMAVAYLMKGDYKGANNAGFKALNIQPDSTIPNLCKINTLLAEGNLGSARFYLRGMTKLGTVQKNNYQDLIEICSRNKELANKVSSHLSLAMAYSNNRWLKRALREYERLTQIIPDSAFAYNAQADILTLTGRGDKAIEIYKKIIELEPESSFAYNKIAAIHNRKGKKDEAEAQYRKVISFDSVNITAHLNLGVIFESKNMVEESIKAYEKVIELAPSSPIAYNNLAWVYISKMQGKLEDALKLAEKAKELAPDNVSIIDTLGWVYFLNGMYDKAMSELETAVRNAPLNPTIRYHMGMAYYKKGLQRLAFTEMEHAIKINNTFPEAKEARELIEKMNKIKSTEKKVGMIR